MKRKLIRKHVVNFLVLLLIVIGMSGIGIYSLLSSHAATPYGGAEAESGNLSGIASIITDDTSASDGAYTLFGNPSANLGACTTSDATGAGVPSKTYTVGAPINGDNSGEIQAQINAASAAGGGLVSMQAGTYIIDATIYMAPNVELSGAGEGTTIIKLGVTDISVINTNKAANITLNGFTADASGNSLNDSNATQYYTIVVLDSTNAIVQNIGTINPFSYAIVTEDDTNFCVRNDNVQGNPDTTNKYNQLDGIHVEDSTKGDVVDNYVDNRYSNGTDGDDGLVAQANNGNESYITYTGNVVRGGNDGDCMQFAVGPDNISHDTVEGNEFWGCTFGIRTGGYANSGSITYTTIINNNVHNLVPGIAPNGSFPDGGNAVDLGGFLDTGQSSSDNTVSNTYTCDAGSVIAESGTIITNTIAYTGCSDAPTTTSPPPVLP